MIQIKSAPVLLLGLALALGACTQEQQNKLGRGLQNWTGTDGVLDIYAGEKLVMRFIKIDKMSTGIGTSDDEPRSYRYGYGVVDENLNWLRTRAKRRCTSRSATTRPPTCSTRTTGTDWAAEGALQQLGRREALRQPSARLRDRRRGAWRRPRGPRSNWQEPAPARKQRRYFSTLY